jgi:small subunit ribosomal protein S18
MKKKLFVSNLDFEATEDQIRELFESLGETSSVSLATERETRRSKGFAFVEMGSAELANRAIEELTGKEINGRAIKVSEDRGKGGGSDFGSERGGSDRFSGSSNRNAPDGGDRRREFLPPIQRMALFKRKRKVDPFMEDPAKTVDYRDVAMLQKFVSERGRILSRRLTGLNAFNQRKIKKAVKRAQNLGLMPFVLQ